MYLRYLTTYHKLERCFEGAVHPQKRIDIAALIEAVLSRIVQLRAIIVKWAPYNPQVAAALKGKQLRTVPWEYIAFDDLLAELRMQPEALELPPPRQYLDDRAAELRKRDQLVSGYMNLKLGVEKVLVELDEAVSESAPPTIALSIEDAVAMIQRNERGRQAAMRASALREKRAAESKAVAIAAAAVRASKLLAGEEIEGGEGAERPSSAELRAAIDAAQPPRKPKHAPTGEDGEDEADLLTPLDAAVEIQRIIRGFLARCRAKAERRKEMSFLGMSDAQYTEAGSRGLLVAMRDVVSRRLFDQANHQEGYKTALPEVHRLVRDEEGGELKDKLKADRLAWLTSQMALGTIPEDMNAYYAFKEAERLAALGGPAATGGAADAAAKGKAEADAKGKGKDAGKDKAKGKGAVVEAPAEVPPVLIGPTPWTKSVAQLLNVFDEKWATRDERDNTSQKHDEDLARAVVRPAVEEELRAEVDAALADQLANFKAAQADKKKEKKKKEKKAKEKKKKEKPLPGAKLCTGMDTDAMLAELVANRIVNNPRKSATFASFYGGSNLSGSSYNQKDTPAQRHPVTQNWIPLDPSMQQVRESVVTHGVMPLGSAAVRKGLEEFAADKGIGAKPRAPRSILLYGPHGAGKTHLAQAIANSTGALFFNISAGNSDGKMQEKGGQAKLLHMAFEVAKDASLGPAVIYIDEVEKMIPGPPPKGKPKPDPNGPARFKKELPVYINSLTAEHAVTVIGCSSAPEEADPKSLSDCFDRFIHVPLPDYATRLQAWKREINDVFSVVPPPEPNGSKRKTAKAGAGSDGAGDAAAAAGSDGGGGSAATPVVDPAPWSGSNPTNAAAPSSEASAAAGAAAAVMSGFGPLPLSPAATCVPEGSLHPLLSDLNFTALATVSNGYSVGAIKAAVRATCTLRRLDAMDVRKLEEMDFINALSRCPRVYQDYSERIMDFTARVTGLDAARVVVVEAAAAKGAKKK